MLIKPEFKNINMDPNNKFLTFQPRNHSRQYHKSKSTKKNQINKNLLIPCQPLGEKLLKAALQKNQRKVTNNRREKTEQSVLQTSMTLDGSRCINHPEKKGEYFLQNHPSKKFCLKCNLTLSNGNPSTFVTKQSNSLFNKEHQKKQTLDKFREQLTKLRQQVQNSKQMLHTSIQSSQQSFAQHSSYINESFSLVKEQLQEKRRQLLNNLIMAQQSVKRQYEDNLKRLKKMGKSIERYEFDIKKFYEQIIDELPKSEFDHIMEEYEEKINKNFKSKLKSILLQDGICVYIPNLQIKHLLDKASVEFYQPLSERSDIKEPCLSFSQKDQKDYQVNDQKRNTSTSLDTKMIDNVSNALEKMPFKLQDRKRQPENNLLERKTGNFLSPARGDSRNKFIEDKENINLQNLTHDYFNHRNDPVSKFAFRS